MKRHEQLFILLSGIAGGTERFSSRMSQKDF